jgi:pimeloyl-ACP methyl ester carboxylesterase
MVRAWSPSGGGYCIARLMAVTVATAWLGASVGAAQPPRFNLPRVIPGPGAPVQPPRMETLFVQVHPVPRAAAAFEPSPGETRAVVLLHGLLPHLLSQKAERPVFRDWQKPGSKLVQALARDSDVYAFAYSQNVAVEDIVRAPGLREGVRRLRQSGYTEVVLVGHSAGGLIARQLVEDYPDTGVTKVVQVCSPNGGSGYAKLELTSKNQRTFLESLTKDARQKCLRDRCDKKIPETVQFVCVVGDGTGVGDVIVSDKAQWTKDLQDQGIPAVRLWTAHFWVTRNRADARKIAELVREDQPRWDAAKVAAMRKKIIRD